MKKDSFPRLLWSSYNKALGTLATIFGIGLGILIWIYKPDSVISLAWAIPIAIVMLLLLSTFAHAAYSAYLDKEARLPELILCRQIEGTCVFLAEPSKLFSHGILVSFFYRDRDNYEQLIALGAVNNIQEDGLIQIELIQGIEGQEDILEQLVNNIKQVMDNTIIKQEFKR